MDPSAELIAQVDELFIEVELRPKDLQTFSQKNMRAGGGPLNENTEGVLVRKGLQGPNVRIYWNGPDSIADQLAMFELIASDGKTEERRGHWRKEYRWRLDSNAFYFKLVRNGFKLGRWPVPLAMAAA